MLSIPLSILNSGFQPKLHILDVSKVEIVALLYPSFSNSLGNSYTTFVFVMFAIFSAKSFILISEFSSARLYASPPFPSIKIFIIPVIDIFIFMVLFYLFIQNAIIRWGLVGCFLLFKFYINRDRICFYFRAINPHISDNG